MSGQIFSNGLSVKLASSLSNTTSETLGFSENSFWKGDCGFHTQSITPQALNVKFEQRRLGRMEYKSKPRAREAAYDLSPWGSNIEFSCRPESKTKHMLLPRQRTKFLNDSHGGQLQRFVRWIPDQ